MGTKLTINSLFAYSEKNNKYSYIKFGKYVNIIYGKNTSGKSTIFQAIMYTMGINDGNEYLQEILEEDVFFRIDCIITKNNVDEKIVFIRDDETVFIKKVNRPVLRFNGINADNSVEHIKLKEYMHKLFGFTLKLENKNEYKVAPIEAMFLPYYVSQPVGWVYIRKSFNSLEFYKNFKEDYLDYYLGIESFVDREKKRGLEIQLRDKEEKIKFYINTEKSNDEFQITKLVDEQFANESREYIESHNDNQRIINEYEEKYISKCNEQSYYQQRMSLLRKVSRHHKYQNPEGGVCPTCNQKLPFSIESSYKYFQEDNDTKKEMKKCREKIKNLQSEINSLRKKIDNQKLNMLKEYNILRKYFNYDLSFDSWIKNKVNAKLINNIKYKLGELTTEKIKIKDSLKDFKTQEEVEKSRLDKCKEFSDIFLDYLDELGVKPLKGGRYNLLYKISAFPSQGVELHKTILAYNFAFNKLIARTENVQRFPFMLDAVFKEDIEQSNKNVIMKFIGKYKPGDTQLILSMAETKENEESVYKYNKEYFNGEANLICIGGATKERAFLTLYDNSMNNYLEDTLNIMNE
ncbi:hypothetical protein [Clostridium sp. AWRP]|uniref:hypothetical protein n=1 Tax=Clostridium sp. AWRP TaxID=2212991 RepID=UPI000FD8D2BE|nr:hypothetical protein [Clostridium sp. AWRP]AZV56769.1 hypothetical protein DMR38_09240 [Clostridium sp. AWRP]